METLTRKQREIAERRQRILDVGRQLLLERGYLGLTMDRVAAEMEYSKGTIYQHFPNKEELVVALAVQTAEKRCEFFQRAATFQGTPRERLAGIGEAADLFQRLYPDHAQAENVVRTTSIRAKMSPEGRENLQNNEHHCMNICSGIVRDGIACGDLTLREGIAPEVLVFGLWAMQVGTTCVVSSDKDMAAVGIPDPVRALWISYNAYLDGFGWKPLSTDHDYAATLERIRAEVFSDEYKQSQR